MTRINLIHPSELSDQHLIAEYREVFMIGSALQRSIQSKGWHSTKEKLPKFKFKNQRNKIINKFSSKKLCLLIIIKRWKIKFF